MSRRGSSLSNVSGTAVAREIDSKYDVIKEVSKYLVEIETVATEDLAALTAALNEAKDFTGITVVMGVAPSWDPATKVLTVTAEKGDKGDKGTAGADGENNYIHIRYAVNIAGGTMSTMPAGREFIGIGVSDSAIGSEAPEDYQWVKYVGTDGVDGVDGVDGIGGANGINGENGMVPVVEFSIDTDGVLLYEVVGYEVGPTVAGGQEQEW